MSWKDRMNAGIGEYLRSLGLDVIEVTGYSEDVLVYDMGGCETCGPEYDKEFTLTIRHLDGKGERKVYCYNGTFTDFINSIT